MYCGRSSGFFACGFLRGPWDSSALDGTFVYRHLKLVLMP